ncbi:MAG: c-type cytochrome biogenesis protein CcmI [Halopseudomonas sp.]
MMILFWSLLVVLVALALMFVWWPWLNKVDQQAEELSDVDRNQLNIDIFKQRVTELELELSQGNLNQAGFDELKLELEQNLLQEVDEASSDSALAAQERSLWVPLGMTLLVPLLSFYLYSQWGSSDLLTAPKQAVAENHPETGHDLQGIDGQVAALKARLEAEPNNSQGWFTLGRSYLTLQRYEDAYMAFGKVGELVGEHAEILSQQAQALYFLNNHQITAEIQKIIDRALELDPQDPGTLGLIGISSYESGQFKKAIDIWQKLVQSDRPNVNREGLQQAIVQAQSQLAQQGVEYQPQQPQLETAAAPGAASLKVLVELDKALKNSVAADTTVFVYAQAVAGPKMPLAVAKLQVRDLPTLVTLDDSMAMGPMAKLSSVEQVQVRATVSLSGTPGAKPGDIQGVVSPVQVAGNDELIKILINEVVN